MFKNKLVFITGASSGIGAACAEQFAQAGAKLLLCARRSDLLTTLAKKLNTDYQVDVHTVELDVSQHDQVKKAWNSLPDGWQNVDIVVNNAGLALGLDLLQDADVENGDAMIDTNVKGLLYITKACLPQMIQKNAGHIINIGSIAGHQVYPKGAVYCATKFAVNAISQGLRMDLSGTKIRVSSVDPGAVETNFSMVRFGGDKARAQSVYQGIDPLTPTDIADAVLYCATRPLHVNVSDIVIMPTDQASATQFSRKS